MLSSFLVDTNVLTVWKTVGCWRMRKAQVKEPGKVNLLRWTTVPAVVPGVFRSFLYISGTFGLLMAVLSTRVMEKRLENGIADA